LALSTLIKLSKYAAPVSQNLPRPRFTAYWPDAGKQKMVIGLWSVFRELNRTIPLTHCAEFAGDSASSEEALVFFKPRLPRHWNCDGNGLTVSIINVRDGLDKSSTSLKPKA
jgi:hypothetical protein